MTNIISQAAIDLIVNEEVSGKAYYEKHYRHPEWPKGASGITIAIGYDVGYATKDKLWSDWRGRIPDSMIKLLEPCCGVHGTAAQARLKSVQAVDVPWDQAIAVFMNRDLPDWISRCRSALPNFDLLPADCRGALVSLAYNRGASFNTARAPSDSADRYREMRAIRQSMAAKEYDRIPGQFRAMKRLWNNGLVGRREREARLFEQGLQSFHPVTPVDVDHVEPARFLVAPVASRTIESATLVSRIGKGIAAAGGVLGLTSVGDDTTSMIDQASQVVDKADQARGLFGKTVGIIGGFVGNPVTIVLCLLLIGAGIYIARQAAKIKAARLDDHASGVNADIAGEEVTDG